MARFYVGQPVVCIKDKAWWDSAPGTDLSVPCPVLGQRYTVLGYPAVLNHVGAEMIWLEEFLHAGIYSETGFAPITDEQVKSIITEAIKLPANREIENV